MEYEILFLEDIKSCEQDSYEMSDRISLENQENTFKCSLLVSIFTVKNS